MKVYNENEVVYEVNELPFYFTNLSKEEIEKLKEYYTLVKEELKDETRKSGSPELAHVLAVAKLVHDIGADSTTIYAALLHHCSEKTLEYLKNKDPEVYEILKYVSEKTEIKKRAENYNYSVQLKRSILIAGLKDFRALIVLLANKVHNLKTIHYLDEKKQKEIAQEVLEIYAPIAHKLGINAFKGQLEDLALKILYPEIYEKISTEVNYRFKEAEIMLKELKQKFSELFPKYKIEGRIKHFYSLMKKLEKGKKLDEIYDFVALRVITKNIEDCYKVLEKIKANFNEIPNRYKDYIVNPKPNGYQSLHDCFLYNGKPFEVQIRTEQMHYAAEFGLAAHWKYKNIDADRLDKFILWSKQMISLLTKVKNDVKVSVFKDKIFVFTPKGDPIELPTNGTALDFAFKVHTELGLHALAAKINGQKMPLSTELKSGDIVEIITSPKLQVNEKWLNIAKSNSVKAMIRSYLNMTKKPTNETSNIFENIKSLINLDEKNIKIAGCCADLKYQDPIVLVYTKNGESIHKANCENILPTYKKIPLSWREVYSLIKVYGKDEDGILLKILEAIKNKVKLLSVDASAESGKFNINLKTSLIEEHKKKEFIKTIMSLSKNIETVEIVETL
ncbi:MAG: HD domain-containing protein [Candidatus Woesearchaeota archaeon]